MDHKTRITFYSGLDTIGAVIMEVRYGNCRAFFEAGTSYNPAFDMFDGTVRLRKNFIADYLWVNEIPKIDGIYRREDIAERYPDMVAAEDYDIDAQAFFITHLHLDHMRMMGMISPLVPVYLSEPAQRIEFALEDVGEGVESIRGRNYLDMDDVMHVGEITIRRFILNDDSYQDYSFYIETPDLKIHHTGDVFVYGKYRDNILKEIEFLNQVKPDILFCEGTRFFSSMNPDDFRDHPITPSFEPANGLITKSRMDERTRDIIRNYDGLIVWNYYEREMSDVMDFEKHARAADRIIVYEPESAHIVNQFFDRAVTVMIPDTYEKEPEWLEDVITRNKVITKSEILLHPKDFIVQITYPNTLELLDYRHIRTLYLHHSGIPLGDFDPKHMRLLSLLKKWGIEYIKTYNGEDGYFSPHAETFQILAYIKMVNARLVVPLHTQNRKAMIANLDCPYFYASLREVYEYNHEANTLEVVDHV